MGPPLSSLRGLLAHPPRHKGGPIEARQRRAALSDPRRCHPPRHKGGPIEAGPSQGPARTAQRFHPPRHKGGPIEAWWECQYCRESVGTIRPVIRAAPLKPLLNNVVGQGLLRGHPPRHKGGPIEARRSPRRRLPRSRGTIRPVIRAAPLKPRGSQLRRIAGVTLHPPRHKGGPIEACNHPDGWGLVLGGPSAPS